MIKYLYLKLSDQKIPDCDLHMLAKVHRVAEKYDVGCVRKAFLEKFISQASATFSADALTECFDMLYNRNEPSSVEQVRMQNAIELTCFSHLAEVEQHASFRHALENTPVLASRLLWLASRPLLERPGTKALIRGPHPRPQRQERFGLGDTSPRAGQGGIGRQIGDPMDFDPPNPTFGNRM